MRLVLTPHGSLLCELAGDAPELDEALAERLRTAFAEGAGAGLLRLGAGEVGASLPPVFAWWRAFAGRCLSALCQAPEGADPKTLPPIASLSEDELASLSSSVPPMPGAEYMTAGVLADLWAALLAAVEHAMARAEADVRSLMASFDPAWAKIGRVHFNLAENRGDPDLPFAFLATYTSRLGGAARAQHVPLGQALREYAGAANKDSLLALLTPVQRACRTCAWLKALVDAGEIFHPLRWSAGEAARFLASVAAFEEAGIVVRMPATWRAARPARPQVTATVGARAPSAIGFDGLLDFRAEVTLEGEPLGGDEIAALLAGTESLVLLRGQWVEIDRARLEKTMRQVREAEALAARDGLTFAEAMRLLSGAALTETEAARIDPEWSRVAAGPWLADTLKALRSPAAAGADPGPALRGTLRPYQQAGVAWLRLLSGLGLGACLADDMGLGKTIQVLSLLLLTRSDEAERPPSLLVAPASLLANWALEIERFAPSLRARIVHPSAMAKEAIAALAPEQMCDVDIVITSYGSLLRIPALTKMRWHFAILDEAQAIKNPGAKQTKAVKTLEATSRIALTGTPVENHLGDLWSIFDFLNQGLLGSAKQFSTYVKSLADRPQNPYGPLRELVSPYILRRMKTDKAVIADLPEKTEVKAFCHLGRKQAALYAKSVAELEIALKQADGIQRSGLILATLMRLKQICNHPSHWLHDSDWAEADSGKLVRLREIAEVAASRQDKMLVFTQFREMTGPLAAFLGGVFGRSGLVLHGDVAVQERKTLVQTFQQDETIPFFVLSLKAGGSGLTLTAASHVVHFDRWWNPAVENQATDRAFRIGQKKNVLVHKFVCRGTIEERIDQMIEDKRSLSGELLDGAGEINLTRMSDGELIRLVALDLKTATAG